MSDENNSEAIPEKPTSLTLANDLDQIIAEINKPYDGKLPAEAIRAAQANREAIIPRLIALLESELEKARAGIEIDSGAANIALLLLAEFKAQASLPTVMTAISLPGEGPFDLFGDTITEDLDRFLAIFAEEPFSELDAIILNQNINQYVRWQACDAFVYLVKAGRIDRLATVNRLNAHLRSLIESKDTEGITGVVSTLVDLWPVEAMDTIRQVYELELVDSSVLDLKFVEKRLKAGEVGMQEHFTKFMEPLDFDTVAEMETWYGYSYGITDKLLPDDDDDEFDPQLGLSESWNFRTDQPEPISRPHRAENAKVGRNDPCPCGSGKKFKKCCASRVNT